MTDPLVDAMEILDRVGEHPRRLHREDALRVMLTLHELVALVEELRKRDKSANKLISSLREQAISHQDVVQPTDTTEDDTSDQQELIAKLKGEKLLAEADARRFAKESAKWQALWRESADNATQAIRERDEALARTANLAPHPASELDSTEQLDALPVGAVVHSDELVFERGENRWWVGIGIGHEFPSADIQLPARILWNPEDDAQEQKGRQPL